jgi:hypothetical protein
LTDDQIAALVLKVGGLTLFEVDLPVMWAIHEKIVQLQPDLVTPAAKAGPEGAKEPPHPPGGAPAAASGEEPQLYCCLSGDHWISHLEPALCPVHDQ